jgi:hypothetical protein
MVTPGAPRAIERTTGTQEGPDLLSGGISNLVGDGLHRHLLDAEGNVINVSSVNGGHHLCVP